MAFFSKLLESVFYQIDLFKFTFFIEFLPHKHKLSTKTGVGLSVLIYVFLIILFFNSDFIKKKNPKVTTDFITFEKRPAIHFNKSNFQIGFGVFDNNASNFEINETIFNFEVFFNIYGVDELNNSININEIRPFHICTENEFPDLQLIKGIRGIYCLDNISMEIKGYLNEKIAQSLIIDVFKCKNSSSFNNCESEDEINNFLQYKYVVLIYYEYGVDASNFEKPLVVYKTIDYMLLDSMNFKKKSYFIRNLQMETDSDPIFDGTSIEQGFNVEKSFIDSSQINKNSSLIFDIQIMASAQIQKTKRIYQKFQEILAYLGAFLSLFMFIANIFLSMKNKFDIIVFLLKRTMCQTNKQKTNQPHNTFGEKNAIDFSSLNAQQTVEKKEQFINSFDISTSKRNNKDYDYETKGPKMKINIDDESIIRNLKKEENINQHHLDKLSLTQSNQRAKPFEINFLKHIKILFYSFFSKKKLKDEETNYLEAKTQIYPIIQLPFIINKLMEIEHLKEIIFSPVQKKMFNLINKPLMKFPSYKGFNDCLEICTETQKQQEIQKAIEYYQNFYSFQDLSKKDKKLFELLNINVI